MQSLISFPSNVEVLSADIHATTGASPPRPFYVFYEWTQNHIQNNNGMRRFMWMAQAKGSNYHKLERPRTGFVVASVALRVSIAYKDIDRVWKQRGIDLANETLDNLVMLYAIQTQREFETESRLTFVPDL
jgi:hypothetical protein